MGRIFSVLSKVMLFSLLGLVLLQGVFDAVVISESDPGGVLVSRSAQTGLPVATAGGKSRSKRCTCYSYKDKECVYYCHLDIIWINTPERTVPYGMSSYRAPQRIRREAVKATKDQEAKSQRCACAVPDDPECQLFCQTRECRLKVCTESQALDDRFHERCNFFGEMDPFLFKSSFRRSWLHRYIYKPEPPWGEFRQAKKLRAYP